MRSPFERCGWVRSRYGSAGKKIRPAGRSPAMKSGAAGTESNCHGRHRGCTVPWQNPRPGGSHFRSDRRPAAGRAPAAHAECIDVMADALLALARGDAILPLRSILWLDGKRGALGLMPAHLASGGFLGVKAVTFFPQNEGTELDSHQGAVLLFDASAAASWRSSTRRRSPRSARPPCRGRRRACSPGPAPATSRSSDRGCRRARTSPRCSRSAGSAGCASRAGTSGAARRFAERESERHRIEIEPVASVKEAVEGADIVCTVTSSREPVVLGDWLAPGAHVNAVGSSVARRASSTRRRSSAPASSSTGASPR